MTSGHKREIANLRERLRSTDQNRLQAFLAADRAEYYRFLYDLGHDVTRPWEAGGPLLVSNIPTDVGTPLRAVIFDGLVVTPIVGSTSVHISPGVVGVQDPDGQAGSSVPDPPSADDSDFKIILEPTGVQTNGVLTIGANAGPGARLDVIECRRSEQVLETDSRDIFDPSAGTSSSVVVDKVGAARLEFRVRVGTAGAGYPGNVQGWLPLVVAHVPSGGGATTNDVDFWDVRPLVKDRIQQPFRSEYAYGPALPQQHLMGDNQTVGAETRIGGHVWGQINGVRAGGKISRGTPGADQDYIDAQDAEWQDASGFAPAARQIYYFWLLFPFSLPRWVRYNRTPVGGLRFPNGMRGVPIVSLTAPAGQAHGPPASALRIPDFLTGGAATTTLLATCVASSTVDTSTDSGAFIVDGEWTALDVETTGLAPTNGTGAGQDEYDLVAGTHYPANARAVRAIVAVTFTGVAGDELDINAFVRATLPGTTSVVASFVYSEQKTFQFGAGTSVFVRLTVEVPVFSSTTMAHLATGCSFIVDWNAAGFATKVNESAQVIGWKLVD